MSTGRWAVTKGASLTEREEQLLFAFADGLTRREIAEELQVSEHTVKDHAKGLFGKLGARNSAHAVALAYHQGILQPKPEAA